MLNKIFMIFFLFVVELMCVVYCYDLLDLIEICRNFLDLCIFICVIYIVFDIV